MGVSKVEYGGSTLIDLTADNVTASALRSGYTAHGADGEQVNGSLVIHTVYTGSSAPTSSVGSDGDLYIVVG